MASLRAPITDRMVGAAPERRSAARSTNIRALRRARITCRSVTRWMAVSDVLGRAAHFGVLTPAAAKGRRDRARFMTLLAPVIDECLTAANGAPGEYCRLIRQRQRDDPAFAAVWDEESNW